MIRFYIERAALKGYDKLRLEIQVPCTQVALIVVKRVGEKGKSHARWTNNTKNLDLP